MAKKKTLTSSLEDYLEAVYHLVQEQRVARVKGIAKRVGVSMPSVVKALRQLAAKGLIHYEPYKFVTLTSEGEAAGTEIARRHEMLCEFMEQVLGVDHETAERNACHMEHAMGPVVLECFVDFLQFIHACPRAGADWLEGFAKFCRRGIDHERCVTCAGQALDHSEEHRSGTTPVQLPDLKPGECGRVVGVKGDKTMRKRIAEHGVAKGALIEMENVASGGESVDIRIRGYHLALRMDEAASIFVCRE
ncbi:MAG: metal-dependent transcriptional regulator [Planctomycetes bacterium]|nr:metal-dependent transcriptional regulator [Planctomycetota bacterium]